MNSGFFIMFSNFEARLPSSFGEQYVVKGISKFFDACDFLDGWVKNPSAKSKPSCIPINHKSVTPPATCNSISVVSPTNFNASSRYNLCRTLFPILHIWTNQGAAFILALCCEKASNLMEFFWSTQMRVQVSHRHKRATIR